MIRTLRVTVNGHEYDVTVEDRTDTEGNRLYPQPGSMVPPSSSPPTTPSPAPSASVGAGPSASAPSASATGAVLAPMSGVLVEILVKVDQEVADGETVAVIEAMKMKTPIVVERGGTVASIDVAEGDGVQVGQSILTIA